MGTRSRGTHLPWGPTAVPQQSKALLRADQHQDLGEATVTWRCQGGTAWCGTASMSTLHPPRPPGWQPALCASVPQDVWSTPGLEQSTTANETQTHPERLLGPPLQPEAVMRFALSLQRQGLTRRKAGRSQASCPRWGGCRSPPAPTTCTPRSATRCQAGPTSAAAEEVLCQATASSATNR